MAKANEALESTDGESGLMPSKAPSKGFYTTDIERTTHGFNFGREFNGVNPIGVGDHRCVIAGTNAKDIAPYRLKSNLCS